MTQWRHMEFGAEPIMNHDVMDGMNIIQWCIPILENRHSNAEPIMQVNSTWWDCERALPVESIPSEVQRGIREYVAHLLNSGNQINSMQFWPLNPETWKQWSSILKVVTLNSILALTGCGGLQLQLWRQLRLRVDGRHRLGQGTMYIWRLLWEGG